MDKEKSLDILGVKPIADALNTTPPIVLVFINEDVLNMRLQRIKNCAFRVCMAIENRLLVQTPQMCEFCNSFQKLYNPSLLLKHQFCGCGSSS